MSSKISNWNLVDEHVADHRAIERSLGISPRRNGIYDAERVYWYESGTVGGLVWNNRRTGFYWLYKWYSERAENMLAVTPSGDLEAENATVVNTRILSAGKASNGGYVGRIDGVANARNSSFVDFVVEVPTAGT